jgi:hypothetical protein
VDIVSSIAHHFGSQNRRLQELSVERSDRSIWSRRSPILRKSGAKKHEIPTEFRVRNRFFAKKLRKSLLFQSKKIIEKKHSAPWPPPGGLLREIHEYGYR